MNSLLHLQKVLFIRKFYCIEPKFKFLQFLCIDVSGALQSQRVKNKLTFICISANIETIVLSLVSSRPNRILNYIVICVPWLTALSIFQSFYKKNPHPSELMSEHDIESVFHLVQNFQSSKICNSSPLSEATFKDFKKFFQAL